MSDWQCWPFDFVLCPSPLKACPVCIDLLALYFHQMLQLFISFLFHILSPIYIVFFIMYTSVYKFVIVSFLLFGFAFLTSFPYFFHIFSLFAHIHSVIHKNLLDQWNHCHWCFHLQDYLLQDVRHEMNVQFVMKSIENVPHWNLLDMASFSTGTLLLFFGRRSLRTVSSI